MNAWEWLKFNSSLVFGTAWEHLKNQKGGGKKILYGGKTKIQMVCDNINITKEEESNIIQNENEVEIIEQETNVEVCYED